eukprot:scaffold5311_cov120-Isochrysis_galbana.AAC.10
MAAETDRRPKAAIYAEWCINGCKHDAETEDEDKESKGDERKLGERLNQTARTKANGGALLLAVRSSRPPGGGRSAPPPDTQERGDGDGDGHASCDTTPRGARASWTGAMSHAAT